jgi:diguanylate cyclase (GGDEF)-like protein
VDELKARLRTGHRILELEDHLVEARESMRFQATHDLLTSLWNRGVIVELMSHEIMRSRRERSCTAVMMCDIDNFKSVNDQFGHAIGDDVLREVARRLHHSVRSYDMVGRYGGEEFLVALNKCNPESAVSRAENLRSKISGCPIQTANKPVTVTISIGLALSTEFTQCTVEELMHQADIALYAAKAGGRNCVRVARPSGVSEPAEEQPKEKQVMAPSATS